MAHCAVLRCTNHNWSHVVRRGECLSELARLPRLRVLSMQDCPLVTNDALARLCGAPALEQLLLDMCEFITDEGMFCSPSSYL